MYMKYLICAYIIHVNYSMLFNIKIQYYLYIKKNFIPINIKRAVIVKILNYILKYNCKIL